MPPLPIGPWGKTSIAFYGFQVSVSFALPSPVFIINKDSQPQFSPTAIAEFHTAVWAQGLN